MENFEGATLRLSKSGHPKVVTKEYRKMVIYLPAIVLISRFKLENYQSMETSTFPNVNASRNKVAIIRY